jgi:hypothetical protein
MKTYLERMHACIMVEVKQMGVEVEMDGIQLCTLLHYCFHHQFYMYEKVQRIDGVM